MKIVVSHPTGNANVRAIVSAFFEADMLGKFFTTAAYFPDSFWLKLGIKDIDRRIFDSRLKSYTITHPLREIARIVTSKINLPYFTTGKLSPFSVDAVYKSLDKFLSEKLNHLKELNAIYGYEDGSYYSFQKAKELALKTIYELPIAYWEVSRKLLNEEAERYPQWKNTLRSGISDSKEKLDKKTRELELADVVVVPSEFVAQSLPEWATNKNVIVSPFGTPAARHQTNRDENIQNRPLRILFVGSMSQRKGLADLFTAIKLLNTQHVELVVLGSLAADINFYRKELSSFRYEPPRLHKEVLELMESCDVFCLPSIVEGRALVMQEAMSRQLPIIITKNTGGEDLIKEGETGFLVPVGNPEAIAEKIEWFLSNKYKIQEMGYAAARHAGNYTWEKYSNTIIETLRTTAI